MAYTPKIVSILWRYYNREPLSIYDQQELQKWLADSRSNQTLFDELSNEKEWKSMLTRLQSKDADPTWQIIKERIDQPSKVKPIAGWLRYAAIAAGMVFLLGGGYYWWISQNRSVEIPQQSEIVKKEILPGYSQAILTLPDGTIVKLDSTGKRDITRGGNKIAILDKGILGYTHSESNELPNQWHQVSTPIGGTIGLVLSDGTRVWLNAGSILKYPAFFSDTERLVDLSGEAYFEVARDLTKAFKVRTSRGEITVLGTHFNINDYEDESFMATTLLEGKVRIKTGIDSLQLVPGQTALASSASKLKLTLIDNRIAMGWRNNSFWFSEASYETILRQIARWYPVEVKFETPVPGKFSGVLPRDRSLSQLLALLEKGGNVHFKVHNQTVIVSH